jgi:hypothetical protein
MPAFGTTVTCVCQDLLVERLMCWTTQLHCCVAPHPCSAVKDDVRGLPPLRRRVTYLDFATEHAASYNALIEVGSVGAEKRVGSPVFFYWTSSIDIFCTAASQV